MLRRFLLLAVALSLMSAGAMLMPLSPAGAMTMAVAGHAPADVGDGHCPDAGTLNPVTACPGACVPLAALDPAPVATSVVRAAERFVTLAARVWPRTIAPDPGPPRTS